MKPLPTYRIVLGKVPGAPYSTSSVYVQTPEGERLAYSCLGPLDDGEAEERVRAYIDPPPARPVLAFEYGKAKTPSPGRPRKDAPPRDHDHHQEDE